ncbi:MAG: hypothetical protein A2Y94_03075 [Caldithrix sp. RBG_13_44_9]|nr:MAG: hypothetical protein A2Y94_03075 [Caldithrix sp. RBG_13_44_9]
MIRNSWPFLALLYFLFIRPAAAQKVIEGSIKDRDSRQSLPAANIQIEGTLKGTISNDQGFYILKLDELPATLIVSYIGYATEKVRIETESSDRQDILLTPVSYELEPIVVTDEDPAVRIMREVIRRKKEWRATLNTYQANAYTRVVLENDTSITSIMESISISYWSRDKGTREIIKSRRQTSNLSADENFAGVGVITNLYDDDIEIAGFKLIGVTHPDALDHYQFHLEGKRQRDNQLVYDISVEPRNKLQPMFIGKIAVLDQDFALLEVDLKPNEAVLFPPPIENFNLGYQQQFNNFGTKYWIPIDLRVNGSIKVGFIGLHFPSIIIRWISRLSDYQINPVLPDSLFTEKEQFTVDSTTITQNPDSIFTSNPEVVPFSELEENAYATLDSTMTLEKAYRPTGPLARFVKVEVEGDDGTDQEQKRKTNLLKDISPVLHFDRVDELTIGLKKSFSVPHLKLDLFGGYKTGHDDWFYGGQVTLLPGEKSRWKSRIGYYENTDTRYSTSLYPLLFSSVHTLLGYRDYYDFFRNRKFNFDISLALPVLQSRLTLGYNFENHQNLSKSTDFNLLGRDVIQRENPVLPVGELRSLNFQLTAGEDYIPFGIIGQNHLTLLAEFCPSEIIKSDFNYRLFKAALDLRIPTFLRRRLLPNAFDIRLAAGTSSGSLPPQRFGTLDGALQIFSPFPSFKSLIGKAYEGEKYFGIFWEHNFRTLPFEVVGWRQLAQKNIGIILHGASGRTWIEEDPQKELSYQPVYQDRFHHEIGLSVNGLFNFFRIDFTQRLDKKEFYAGFTLSRIF